MKTTIEVPDELYYRSQAEATLRGCKLSDLVAEGLQFVLESSGKTPHGSSLTVLTKRSRGIVNSGVPDLASNWTHLASFGRGDSA